MIYIALTYLFSPILYLLLFFRKKDIRRILVIQTAKIGDLICSTSVFRAIKKKYPDAHLSALVNPVAIELLEYNPYINEIVSLDNGLYKGFTGKMRLAKLFRNGRYDIAVSLNPNVPLTLAMLWGLIPVRVSIMPDFSGITYRLASMFSTHLEKHIRGRLVAETYMEMLKAIGIDSKDIAKDVFKSPDADKRVVGETLVVSHWEGTSPSPTKQNSKLVGLAVTSGNRLKEWGAEKIAALINKLVSELNAYIVLIGSEKDQDVADKIFKTIMRHDKVINTVGVFTISELPALIESLSLFIGVDTGIIYMADALNIPVVDIAGPSDMEDQRPTGRKIVIIQKNLPCVPCSHTFKAPYECRYGHRKCITDITVEEVFQGASKLLA
ncbi:MAG: glycosyltransferase family 9 protein [Deltaproteobacteria bacterium]|nr:glycosyltransferase family 9 protein [Deltaproteobacteria bacterium]